MPEKLKQWPWLTVQIICANVAVILALGTAWYFAFMAQSNDYSDRLMETFNIEPGSLHSMYVDDVERQLWASVSFALIAAIVASSGLAYLIVRPLRVLAGTTERLRHGDYRVDGVTQTGEIGRLSKNVVALAQALELEDRRRTQYLADLSHELRTPITSLRGHIEGLEDGVFTADKKFFALMADELGHLSALTQTIDAMKLDAPQAPSRSMSSGDGPGESQDEELVGDGVAEAALDSTLTKAVARWQGRFAEAGLSLETDGLEVLTGRSVAMAPSQLRQIFDNLLANMVSYAASERPCTVVAQKDPGGRQICLRFANAAPDLTEAVLPFLFDRFYRVSNSRTRRRHAQASGLGLSIVKQLCLAHGGTVTASLADTILTFSVRLPLRPA
ncbi:MAG: sensor histidine kinase [Rhodospirillaceae bacterium]